MDEATKHIKLEQIQEKGCCPEGFWPGRGDRLYRLSNDTGEFYLVSTKGMEWEEVAARGNRLAERLGLSGVCFRADDKHCVAI